MFLKKEWKKVLILKFLTEEILLITVCIINKDIKQYRSWYGDTPLDTVLYLDIKSLTAALCVHPSSLSLIHQIYDPLNPSLLLETRMLSETMPKPLQRHQLLLDTQADAPTTEATSSQSSAPYSGDPTLSWK